MATYANRSGKSSVIEYNSFSGGITIKFDNGTPRTFIGYKGATITKTNTYVYDTTSTSSSNIATIKRLALDGFGLNRFLVKQAIRYSQKHVS